MLTLLLFVAVMLHSTEGWVAGSYMSSLSVCVDEWLNTQDEKLIRMNLDLISETMALENFDQISSGLSALTLLEPYAFYLMEVSTDQSTYTYLRVFDNFCSESGMSMFTQCLRLNLTLSPPEELIFNGFMSNYTDRYCKGNMVRRSIIKLLEKGKNDLEIHSLLSSLLKNSPTLCSSVLSQSGTVMAALTSSTDRVPITDLLHAIQRMVAGNAMCVQRKLGKNNAILYHHLDSVIYTLMEHIPGVDINSTKEETELGNRRQTMAAFGGGYTLNRDDAVIPCQKRGGVTLIEDKYAAVTTSISYKDIDQARVPYFASFHLEFSLFDGEEQVGIIMYDTGLVGNISNHLTYINWQTGTTRQTSEVAGIEARSLNTGIYEIVDTRTGAHYLVHRTYGQEQTILTVRVSVSASSYSAGAFIDGCSRKSVLALSMMIMDRRCSHACTTSLTLRNSCIEDCVSFQTPAEISEHYSKLQQMIIISEVKDFLIIQQTKGVGVPTSTTVPLTETTSGSTYYSNEMSHQAKTAIGPQNSTTRAASKALLSTTPKRKQSHSASNKNREERRAKALLLTNNQKSAGTIPCISAWLLTMAVIS